MPEFLGLGPDAVLYGILDQVVDEYQPVAAGLENDVDEIEDDLFGADPGRLPPDLRASRQVITFQRATSPLAGILQALMDGARTVRRSSSCRTTTVTRRTTLSGSTSAWLLSAPC